MQGKAQLAKDQYSMDIRTITKEVSMVYYEIAFWEQMRQNFHYLDSLYFEFVYAANRKYELGESNYLEKLTAETKGKEVSLKLKQINESIRKAYINLNLWLQADSIYKIDNLAMERIELIGLDTISHPAFRFYADAMKLSDRQLNLEKQRLLPDLNASVFNGMNDGPGRQSFSGFQVGIAIPLWFGNQKSQIAAAKIGSAILVSESENYKIQLSSKYLALQSDLRQFEEGLKYYDKTGKTLAKETLFHATKAFQNGEINFLQYIQLLENAKSIESTYLNNLFQYNMTVLEANYIMN